MAARTRRRDSSLIWPGFVDAVTTLLMVLMFVLTIFTVMQSVLRDEITSQDTELDALTSQVAQLADGAGAGEGEDQRSGGRDRGVAGGAGFSAKAEGSGRRGSSRR